MKGLVQGIVDSKWKAALFGFGMLFCYSWCIAAWIEWGNDGVKAFFQPLGMIFVTLWFLANFGVIKEQDEENMRLKGKIKDLERTIKQSHDRLR